MNIRSQQPGEAPLVPPPANVVDENSRKSRLKSTIARLKFKKFGGSLNQLEERVV